MSPASQLPAGVRVLSQGLSSSGKRGSKPSACAATPELCRMEIRTACNAGSRRLRPCRMKRDLAWWLRIAVVAVGVAALSVSLAGAGVFTGSDAKRDDARTAALTDTAGVRLVAFNDCEAALTELRRAALPLVGPYGLGGWDLYAMGDVSGGGAPPRGGGAAARHLRWRGYPARRLASRSVTPLPRRRPFRGRHHKLAVIRPRTPMRPVWTNPTWSRPTAAG